MNSTIRTILFVTLLSACGGEAFGPGNPALKRDATVLEQLERDATVLEQLERDATVLEQLEPDATVLEQLERDASIDRDATVLEQLEPKCTPEACAKWCAGRASHCTDFGCDCG